MNRHVRGWAGVFAALSLFGACGKSTDDSAGAIPWSELPARVAAIICEGRGRCCQNGGISFDVATCKQLYTAEFQQELDAPSANVVYDGVAAGECLDEAAAHSQCGQVDDDGVPACDRVFLGTLAVGASCSQSMECHEAAGQRVSCTSPDGTAPKVCTLLDSVSSRHGKVGEACDGSCASDNCGVVAVPVGPGVPTTDPATLTTCYRSDGLYCDFDVGTCAALAPLGAACAGYDECAVGGFCDYTTGTCVAPRADGSACDGDAECRSDNCSYDGDFGVGTCAPANSLSARECSLSGGDSSEASPPPQAP